MAIEQVGGEVEPSCNRLSGQAPAAQVDRSALVTDSGSSMLFFVGHGHQVLTTVLVAAHQVRERRVIEQSAFMKFRAHFLFNFHYNWNHRVASKMGSPGGHVFGYARGQIRVAKVGPEDSV